MVFRNLLFTTNELNALRWFRREVDSHVTGNSLTPVMKEILGENYQPRYEGLLDLIPFEEFTDIQLKPLGHGRYGEVIAATWHRPRSMEHKQAREIAVVLKRVLPNLKLSERERKRKFFHEVQILGAQD